MPEHRFIEELVAPEHNHLIGHHNMLVVGTFNAADQKALLNDTE